MGTETGIQTLKGCRRPVVELISRVSQSVDKCRSLGYVRVTDQFGLVLSFTKQWNPLDKSSDVLLVLPVPGYIPPAKLR